MNYSNPFKMGRTSITRLVCSLCFLAFCFLWLYAFQADILAVAQHVLSHGQTHYDRTIGAILITFVLQLLQWGVFSLTKLSRRTHALTYFPSMLALAIITDIEADALHPFSSGVWVWLAPLLLVVWGVIVWFSRQLLPFESDAKLKTGLFSRRMWLNLAQMLAMMLMVAGAGNSHSVFHYRVHAEMALINGNADEAARLGQSSLETDSPLTMLRAYALSLQGQLGERLFQYPISGSSDQLLPNHNHLLILSPDSIWKHLGGRPLFKMSAYRYYDELEKDSLATTAVADYKLCSYLIDGRLDDFVKTLPQYYEVADSLPLPRHYKEALVLYKHITKNPLIVFSDSAVEQDWDSFKQLESEWKDVDERRLRIFENYRTTYWFYYFSLAPSRGLK